MKINVSKRQKQTSSLMCVCVRACFIYKYKGVLSVTWRQTLDHARGHPHFLPSSYEIARDTQNKQLLNTWNIYTRRKKKVLQSWWNNFPRLFSRFFISLEGGFLWCEREAISYVAQAFYRSDRPLYWLIHLFVHWTTWLILLDSTPLYRGEWDWLNEKLHLILLSALFHLSQN